MLPAILAVAVVTLLVTIFAACCAEAACNQAKEAALDAGSAQRHAEHAGRHACKLNSRFITLNQTIRRIEDRLFNPGQIVLEQRCGNEWYGSRGPHTVGPFIAPTTAVIALQAAKDNVDVESAGAN